MRPLDAFWALCLSLFLCACQPPYDSETQMNHVKTASGYTEYTHNKNTPAQIHIVETGNKDTAPIIFIHGAPGGWEAWGGYLSDKDLLAKTHMIAVDRPGYGGSRSGNFEASLAIQAKNIYEAVKPALRGKKAVWVGHSFGGPVIAQIAMDYPHTVKKLVFLAASVDPELEKPTWYQKWAVSFPIKYVIPKEMVVAAQEILPLKEELLKQNAYWRNLIAPIAVIQGEKDTLVPPGNADYIARQAVNADLTMMKLPGANHFLPWLQFDLVKKTIMPDGQKGSL